jgi:hypothetical protein
MGNYFSNPINTLINTHDPDGIDEILNHPNFTKEILHYEINNYQLDNNVLNQQTILTIASCPSCQNNVLVSKIISHPFCTKELFQKQEKYGSTILLAAVDCVNWKMVDIILESKFMSKDFMNSKTYNGTNCLRCLWDVRVNDFQNNYYLDLKLKLKQVEYILHKLVNSQYASTQFLCDGFTYSIGKDDHYHNYKLSVLNIIQSSKYCTHQMYSDIEAFKNYIYLLINKPDYIPLYDVKYRQDEIKDMPYQLRILQ